jgi:hypothetical protein
MKGNYNGVSEVIPNNINDHYNIWYLILLVIIIIILITIAFTIINAFDDIKDKLLIPLSADIKAVESRIAAAESHAQDIASRLEGWESNFTQEDVEKARVALENLAFMKW